MKILLTGAGGLLGTEIDLKLNCLRDRLGIVSMIRQRRGSGNGYASADLSGMDGIAAITSLDWDVLIHTAAAKDPDYCEKHQAEAEALNVVATRMLAEEAARRKAKVLYICTDYVFPGTNPPYAENAAPAPINFYGKTKLSGEQAVLEASPENCSLRVPILYGLEAGVKHSAVLSGSLAAIIDRNEKYIDDFIYRYPTCTSDVAAAVVLLLEKGGRGIYHCTGKEKETKYSICVKIAELLGLPHDHIKPLKTMPTSPAARPVDAHLSATRLEQLGFHVSLPFTERLESYREILQAYLASGGR